MRSARCRYDVNVTGWTRAIGGEGKVGTSTSIDRRSRSRGANVDEEVLAIEPGDLLVVPEQRPKHVDGVEAMGREPGGPIRRPLLVEVDLPLLSGDRRREEHDWRERAKERYEAVGCLLRQVFGDLQADGEVEVAIGRRRMGEVGGPEPVAIDPQQIERDPFTVDSDDVGDPSVDECPEPAPVPQPTSTTESTATMRSTIGTTIVGGWSTRTRRPTRRSAARSRSTRAAAISSSRSSDARPKAHVGRPFRGADRVAEAPGRIGAMDGARTVVRRVMPMPIRRAIGNLRRQRQGQHWVRVVMDREIERYLMQLDPSRSDALEISGNGRSGLPWKSFTSVQYPDFDLLAPRDIGRFDVVICEQVLEHVADPWRATQTLAALCRPGGSVVVSTPFMLRVHPNPVDHWRFTPSGLTELLRSAGLDVATVGSWGNSWCIRRNHTSTGRSTALGTACSPAGRCATTRSCLRSSGHSPSDPRNRQPSRGHAGDQ